MTTQELKKIEERCESHYLDYSLPFPYAYEDVKRLLSHTKAQDEEIERLKARVWELEEEVDDCTRNYERWNSDKLYHPKEPK